MFSISSAARCRNRIGRQTRRVSTDKGVFYEDFSPDHDQPYSTNCLGNAAKLFADETTDQNPERRHQEGRAPDCEGGYDDVGVDEGQGDADRHRIDARTNNGHYQYLQGMAVWVSSRLGMAWGIPHHFGAHWREESEGGPAVFCGRIGAWRGRGR